MLYAQTFSSRISQLKRSMIKPILVWYYWFLFLSVLIFGKGWSSRRQRATLFHDSWHGGSFTLWDYKTDHQSRMTDSIPSSNKLIWSSDDVIFSNTFHRDLVLDGSDQLYLNLQHEWGIPLTNLCVTKSWWNNLLTFSPATFILLPLLCSLIVLSTVTNTYSFTTHDPRRRDKEHKFTTNIIFTLLEIMLYRYWHYATSSSWTQCSGCTFVWPWGNGNCSWLSLGVVRNSAEIWTCMDTQIFQWETIQNKVDTYLHFVMEFPLLIVAA